MNDKNDLVWYAAYGSNICEERFDFYISGGEFAWADKTYQGCTNKSEPRASRALFIPHQLFFTRNSSLWNGGVAFIDPRRSEETNTLGRAWLITREQFIEIMQQECGVDNIDCDWDKFLHEKRFRHSEGWYKQALVLEDDREGYPVCTFTGTIGPKKVVAPSREYLLVIIMGLIETYALGKKAVCDQLAQCPGIIDNWSKGKIGKIWEEAITLREEEQNLEAEGNLESNDELN